jgi:FHS family Na+ dependent glucose MFS transporter 1
VYNQAFPQLSSAPETVYSMSTTKRTPKRSIYILAYYGCLVAVGLMVGIFSPTLGALAQQTGKDLQGISLILAMRPLGYLAGTWLCGRLLDRMPGHPIMAGATAVAACTLLLMPLTPVLGLLAGLILVMGCAQGLMDVGSNTLLVWVCHNDVGPYMIGLHFAFALGAFLGPVLVAQALLRTGSHPWAFWVLALALLPLVLFLLKVPSPAHEATQEERAAPPRAPLNLPLTGLILGFFFLYSGAEAGFGAWIYSYATRQGLSSPTDAAYLCSLFWGLLGLGRLIGIPIAAKVPPKTFLGALIPLVLLPLLVLLFGPQTHAVLWLATAGMGLSLACIFPTLLVYAGHKLSHGGRVSGKLTSYFFVGASSGCMALPWLMGQVIEPWGPRAAMGLPLVALGLMGTVFLAILRRQD